MTITSIREASSGLRASQESDVRSPTAQSCQSREMEGQGCADQQAGRSLSEGLSERGRHLLQYAPETQNLNVQCMWKVTINLFHQ